MSSLRAIWEKVAELPRPTAGMVSPVEGIARVITDACWAKARNPGVNVSAAPAPRVAPINWRRLSPALGRESQIGRASCRERVEISGEAVCCEKQWSDV